MYNSKIIRFLKLLTENEMRRFGQFVRSPYFNTLNNVIKLYDILKRYHPGFDSTVITKENIFFKIFPGEKYDDLRIRTLNSYLLKLAKTFLAIERYDSSEKERRIGLVDTMIDKGSYEFAEYEMRDAETFIMNIKRRDINYYFSLYRLTYNKNVLAGSFKNKRYFQKEADALTVFYIASVLRTYATAFNIKSSLELDMRTGPADLAASLAETDPFRRIPVIKLNYALYMVARYTGNEKYFFQFTRLVDKYPSVYKPDELDDIYRILLNFCVLNIRNGIRKFIPVKFELYKKMLLQRIYSEDNYMPNAFFSNTVTSSLENSDAAYAAEFIEKYRHYLNPLSEKDITSYSYAKLYYHKKEFGKALDCLSRAGNLDDVFYKTAVRDLNIKIFYDSGDYEHLYSLIDNYKRFIDSNKMLTKAVKKGYKLYLGMLEKLLRISDNRGIKDTELFVLELKHLPGFINRDWILEKALQLVNNK